MTLALVVTLIAATSEPSTQEVIFYNARMAERAGRPTDALRLWLLRNSARETGARPRNDADFASVVWAALGDLGLCQDGLARDDAGAGLWPLAMHNWVLTSVAKGGPDEVANPYDTFEVGLQQRFISLRDVLDVEELKSVSFFRSTCLRPLLLMLEDDELRSGDLNDRLISGPLLQALLRRSLATLQVAKIQNRTLIEARLFDLELALADLRRRTAGRTGAEQGAEARAAGASAAAAASLRERFERQALSESQKQFLRATLEWQDSDWLALSRARRLFLFSQVNLNICDATKERAPCNAVALRMVDALIAQKAGSELDAWLGWLSVDQSVEASRLLTDGERGKRLLELDATSGFRERGIVSLHRGVQFLERGELRDALISFAFAMANAEGSREAATTLALSRRWVSYVLSRYQATDEVIATLKALVPAQEFNIVVQELIWRATLNTDVASFDRLIATTRRGSAFDVTAGRMRLLAQGNVGALATQLRDALESEPFFTVRFMRQLIEKLEAEELDVRRANVLTLKLLVTLLDSIVAPGKKASSSNTRAAEELIGRAQAMLEALKAFEPSTQSTARALSPSHEAFAGNVRLAPTDALPWPFRVPEPEAPSAFVPLVLKPVEWRDSRGALVFGWRISE